MVKDHLFNLGSKLWNPLPIGIKYAISPTDFKERIKLWDRTM